MLNQVMLLGHVGQAPEIRSTGTGVQVAMLSLATSEKWTDKKTNEKKERTEWHRIVVWHGGLVTIVEKFVAKGSKLYVAGKLQTKKWRDQQGVDRYTTEIVLNGFDAKLVLLDKNPNGGYEQPPPPMDIDDDIPF
jgi:single-strand DNA-binding protein